MLRLIPNILTFSRLILTIVFLIMILYTPQVANKPFFLDIAFVIFIIAGLTDIADGPVARKLNVTSKFGRMIDPLADKALVCGAFVCFAIIGEPKLFLVCGAFVCFAIIGEPKLFGFGPGTLAAIHWSVAGILIAREAYVTTLRHIAEASGVNFAATVSGKVKMFLQSFAIGTVIIKMAHVQTAPWGNWFTTVTFALMLVITVISGLRATQRSSRKETAAPVNN
ncbi:MAG: CDP-alcohol phosphatidyltransferase family protein [Planctomycetota bacterium]|jgi:phosphatidylglycerophosphate synthase